MSGKQDMDTNHDDVLSSVLRDCKTVPVFLDKIFGFLKRKSDFYHESSDSDPALEQPKKIVKRLFNKWKHAEDEISTKFNSGSGAKNETHSQSPEIEKLPFFINESPCFIKWDLPSNLDLINILCVPNITPRSITYLSGKRTRTKSDSDDEAKKKTKSPHVVYRRLKGGIAKSYFCFDKDRERPEAVVRLLVQKLREPGSTTKIEYTPFSNEDLNTRDLTEEETSTKSDSGNGAENKPVTGSRGTRFDSSFYEGSLYCSYNVPRDDLSINEGQWWYCSPATRTMTDVTKFMNSLPLKTRNAFSDRMVNCKGIDPDTFSFR